MTNFTKVHTQILKYESLYFYDDESYSGFGPHTISHSKSGGIGGFPSTLTSSVTVGDNIPNWKYLISKGLCATTSMLGTVMRVIKAQEGHYHAYWKMVPDNAAATNYEIREDLGIGYFGIPAPTFPNAGNLSLLPLATADNRALARYNEKVASVNRQFQGGVFLGELAEALHGIRHPAEALFKGIESYSSAATKLRRTYVKSKADFLSLSRNRRRKVARSFSDAATGLWLEKSFHWLPLMYDIQGAFSALQHTLDQTTRQFVKASATDVQSKTNVLSSFTGPRIYTGVLSKIDSVGASVKYYGMVRVGPRVSFVPDLKALGFDPRSFIPTIWELIPYSWAIDYFTNIGDVLYGLSYGGSDVMWSSKGTKQWARRSQRAGLDSTKPVPTSGWHFVALYGNMKESEVDTEAAYITRSVFNGPYTPGLDYKIPGLSLKWLNLGAVFLQRSLSFL
jgi:hypothetical protein